ncbi:hypothetical protein NUW54_g4486 [Trametes sanguinea]|uniref:Uncharacterized protein n=1 Tax=Trametes sanguinea TaxID=158606 RepID=A0ACC1PZX4_9APHY|nr:hypothetical protein NUW54_g4486 [Trametes sanguinea]
MSVLHLFLHTLKGGMIREFPGPRYHDSTKPPGRTLQRETSTPTAVDGESDHAARRLSTSRYHPHASEIACFHRGPLTGAVVLPGPNHADEERLWDTVRSVFTEAGIDLWRSPPRNPFQLSCPDRLTLSGGFAYLLPARVIDWFYMREFNSKRAVHLENIVFGIFPYLGGTVQCCCEPWLRSSVGDVVDIILQCLEALAFIHALGIAHRDTDKSNFMVQWYPESLANMQVPLTRPRVYLNDFEFALDFCNPFATTEVQPPDSFQREVAPEVRSSKPYDPFKADVWQFGSSFADFQSTIPAIDKILENLVLQDSAARPTAAEARDQLTSVVHSMPPTSLLICPVVSSYGVWQTTDSRTCIGKRDFGGLIERDYLQSTVPAINDMPNSLTSADTAIRPTRAEARDQMADVVHSMLPVSLLICPVVFEKGRWQTVESWNTRRIKLVVQYASGPMGQKRHNAALTCIVQRVKRIREIPGDHDLVRSHDSDADRPLLERTFHRATTQSTVQLLRLQDHSHKATRRQRPLTSIRPLRRRRVLHGLPQIKLPATRTARNVSVSGDLPCAHHRLVGVVLQEQTLRSMHAVARHITLCGICGALRWSTTSALVPWPGGLRAQRVPIVVSLLLNCGLIILAERAQGPSSVTASDLEIGQRRITRSVSDPGALSEWQPAQGNDLRPARRPSPPSISDTAREYSRLPYRRRRGRIHWQAAFTDMSQSISQRK